MLITVAELQLDPIEFDEHFSPEAIEYGEDIRQLGPLDTKGRADLIEEHRGHKQVVPEVRVPWITLPAKFRLPTRWEWMRARRSMPSRPRRRRSDTITETV